MRKLIVGLVVSSLVLCFGATPSFAKKGAKKDKGPDAAFKKMDTNGDGKLSLDEFKAGHDKKGKKGKGKAGKGKKGGSKEVAKEFKKLDKNKDGFLSLKEFKAAKDKSKGKKKMK